MILTVTFVGDVNHGRARRKNIWSLAAGSETDVRPELVVGVCEIGVHVLPGKAPGEDSSRKRDAEPGQEKVTMPSGVAMLRDTGGK